MKTIVLATLLLSACASQNGGQPPSAVPSSAANTDDSEIRATVLAVYNVISGPAGRRDWKRFEDLFAPGARMMVSNVKDGAPANVVLTPKEYIERVTPTFNEKGFFERPIATTVTQYANIAHVWSTYATFDASNDAKPAARGINSFQLVRIGNDWKVLSILWEKEDEAHPIPAQYAPR